jgi:D-3-phosphoglycerate dehydrogenase
MSPAPRSTCSSTEPAKENPLFGIRTWSARRISAPPPRGAGERRAAGGRADVDYLLTGAITNALNMPSISAEEAPKLRPSSSSPKSSGSFAGQLTETGLKAVRSSMKANVADAQHPRR